MNRLSRLSALALFGAVLLAPVARAITIQVYADGAPNAYGPVAEYDAWWAAAKDAAVNGTFVNMANSVDPRNIGTQEFNIRDAVVYSFGDCGRRLHFVYWIPGATVADLEKANFQIGIDLVWDGITYTDWTYGTDWVTPHSWSDYSGGVIGTAGAAFWAANGVNTPEALEADIASYRPYTDAFSFRVRAANLESTTLLTVTQRVPDAASTLALVILGLGALAGWCRRVR